MQHAVRRLSIEATTRGVKEATADAKALSGAVDGVAVSSRRAERATQSLESRFNSIQRRYDAIYRAQLDQARVERTLMQAQQQGLVTEQRRLELLSMAAERHGLASAAMNRETAAIEQQTAALTRQNVALAANDNSARFRRQNLTYQLFDIGQMAALGQNPAMLAMQQGPQIAQLYAGQGGVNAALKDTTGLLGGIASRFGPIAVAAGVAALAIESIRREAEKGTDVAVTFGDTFKATYQVITAGIYSELEPAIGTIAPWFEAAWEAVATAAQAQFNATIQVAMFAIETIKYGWSTLPDALIATASAAAQGFVDMMVWMARETVVIINGLLTDINGFARKVGLDDVVPLLPNPNKLIPDVDVESIIGGAEAVEALKKRTAEYNATIEDIAKRDYWGDLKKAIADQAIINAQERLNEAIKDQVKVERDRIDELKLDIELVGKTAAEIARLTAEHERLAAAKAAAEKDGRIVSQGEIDRIKAYAAEVGKLTEQLAVAKAMDDLTFQRAQIGRTDDEKEVYEKIRSIGVDINSDAGERLATEIRINQALEDQVDSAKELADALREGAASFLEDIFTGKDVMESLVSLGSKFASINFDKFVEGASNWFNGNGFTLDAADTKATAAAVGKEIGAALAPAVSTALKSVSAASDAAGSAAALGKSIAAGITPALETSLSSSMDAFAAAIRKIESGSYAGNYGAIGPATSSGDHAYGAYQVMGANIGPWTKEVLGKVMTIPEFLADSAAQDKVFYAKFGQSLDRWGSAADAVSVWFTGKPNALAGGSVSDGFNTNDQYQAKFTSALAGVPDAVKSGAAAGTETGSSKGVETAVQQTAAQSSSTGSMGQGAMGLLGLGFGAFSTGYQSADPIMGGLGGAIQGFGAGMSMTATLGAAAGPIGAVVGGLVGLISGFLGQADEEEKELEQAKEELESQLGAITKLIRTAAGEFVGVYEEAFLATSDEITKAAELARKAGDDELAEELEDSLSTFFDSIGEQWKIGLQGAVEYGIGSPYTQAVDAVFSAREQLIGFVDDAKFFTDAAGDVQTALDNLTGAATAEEPVLNQYDESYRRSGSRDADIVHNDLVDGYMDLAVQVMEKGVQAFNDSGAQLYGTVTELKQAAEDAGLVFDEAGQIIEQAAAATDDYAGAVADAAQAAQQAALDMLNAPDPLTDIEEQLQALYGTAAALPSVLEELGMTAEEAAAAVDENLTEAIAKLAKTFSEDLAGSINDLSDKTYLNDIKDALAAYDERLSDAARLGLDLGSGVDNQARQEIALAVTEIVKQADLTSDQIMDLIAVFPELTNVLYDASLAVAQATRAEEARTGALDAIEAVEDAADRALDDALGKVQDFFDEVAAGADRMRDFAAAISDFRDSIKLNADVSTLSPQQRLDEARRQFEDVAAKAASGDAAAMDKLTSSAQSYLDEARGFFGSSSGYVDTFDRVNDVLASNEKTALAQADTADQALDYARQQVDGLDAANDNLRTIDQAIADLKQSVIDFSAVETEIALAQQQVDLARQQIDELKAVNDNVMTLGQATAALAQAMAYYTGVTAPETVFQGNTSNGRVSATGHGFASGGYTGDMGVGDIAGVVHGREYVFDAAATARIGVANLDAMRSGASGSDEMTREVRNLARVLVATNGDTARVFSEEIAALRGEVRRLTTETQNAANKKRAA